MKDFTVAEPSGAEAEPDVTLCVRISIIDSLLYSFG